MFDDQGEFERRVVIGGLEAEQEVAPIEQRVGIDDPDAGAEFPDLRSGITSDRGEFLRVPELGVSHFDECNLR